MVAEAPSPIADNITSSYTAFVSTALGLVMPLVAYVLF
jgi:NADH-quinone oxidoreductase subunit N